MDIVLVVLAALLVVSFAIVQYSSLARWRGAWRIAAVLPLVGVAFVVMRIVVDTRRDPTSHNLWPFEIVVATVVALGALGLLGFIQRIGRMSTRS